MLKEHNCKIPASLIIFYTFFLDTGKWADQHNELSQICVSSHCFKVNVYEMSFHMQLEYAS